MPSINQMTSEWAQNKNIPCILNEEVASTNDQAKIEFSKQNSQTAIYLANHQTAGRGRFDRKWEDTAAGTALLSTWCFKSPAPVQPIFSPLVGLALFQSLGFHFPSLQKTISVKPPNDLYLQEAKLCGLLIESSVTGDKQDIFVGLGMNVFDKPKIDIPTASLNESETIDTSTWYSFCQAFYDGIKEAIHISQKDTIPTMKRKQLLAALNNFKPHYEEVFANGDLKTKDQVISWQDL